MNRKLIFVALLVLVLLWFVLQEPNVNVNPIFNNTVQKVEESPKFQAQELPQIKSKQALIKSSMSAQVVNDIEPLDLDGMSYLAVYRLYRKAKLCHRYYAARDRKGDDWQAIDYIDSFWAEKERKWLRKGHEAIDFVVHEKQNEILHSYVEMCELTAQNWSASRQKAKSGEYSKKQSLYDLLLVKKTKTSKEAKIKKLVNLQRQTQVAVSELVESIEGEDTWPKERLVEFKNHIQTLRKKQILKHDHNDEFAERHNKEIWAEIDSMYEQLNSQKAVNPEQVQARITGLSLLLDVGTQELKSKDADIYLLAKYIAEMNEGMAAFYSINKGGLLEEYFLDDSINLYSSDYVFPTKTLMNKWGLSSKNSILGFSLIKATQILYYCGLNTAECGPNSLLMVAICLDMTIFEDSSACGVSVVDYYFNGQLTAGQIHDVEWMLDVMERHYAP